MNHAEMLASATPRPWDWTTFTHYTGRPIHTVQDVVETTAFSAHFGSAELWGATPKDGDRDEEGQLQVIFYSGNGPRSEVNAQLAINAVNAYETLLETLRSIRDHANPDCTDADNYRSDDPEGALDTIFALANKVLPSELHAKD
jgi:hypothetical protein